jgi:hypothetical protein
MINVRPAQGNLTRGVDDETTRSVIRELLSVLVVDA